MCQEASRFPNANQRKIEVSMAVSGLRLRGPKTAHTSVTSLLGTTSLKSRSRPHVQMWARIFSRVMKMLKVGKHSRAVINGDLMIENVPKKSEETYRRERIFLTGLLF